MASLLDALVLGFGVFFYAFTGFVFVLRAYGKSGRELSLKTVFSLQFIPFLILLVANLYQGQMRQAVTLFPMLAFLGYDYWYRVYTGRKPVHHPDRWPWELVVYLVLLFAGGIGVNWYGFLVSDRYGVILVVSFFAMMGAYSLYQYRHNKGKS